ncbi:unnamed protein product [Wickerhamomyces anomalus]
MMKKSVLRYRNQGNKVSSQYFRTRRIWKGLYSIICFENLEEKNNSSDFSIVKRSPETSKEDLSQYNDELLSTINENSSSFDVLSPELRSSNDPHNYGVSYKSDTESSAFTNISVGDISPFENSDLDNPVNEDGGNIDNVINDDESFKSMSDEELFSSTQGTLLGVDTQSCNTSINHQQPNLVNLQSTNGSRQVRYYTSMSVLDRFKKYFK